MWLAVTVNASEQVPVSWEGAVNAWRVAGSVYRMGRREWLTAAGWQEAYRDGVRTVIDLRNPGERQPRATDPEVGEALAAFEVVHAPTEDPDHGEFKALCVPYLNDPAYYAANARFFPDRLAAVFKAVAAASPGGVVIHCSAGRDRSGMVAAMLQDLAGATDDHIVKSYQAAMRGINERHRTLATPHPHERYLDDEALSPLLASRGAVVLEFVRSLNTREYLLRHGVTSPELEAILSVLGARVSL
ncbi:tyrosine-protein phosphatase [Arthrobacter pascens]|uniref:tyrosine-protein phosphatase n=1 Tax=Arthrobacter pascens TaxID=1677 RepID=UPI00196A23EE|nr:tyrosine-protein phosphatase [Arthrobacter pascens]MBN3497671.1 tyrosine-protein phosphatase [Arthrobacter pascens]